MLKNESLFRFSPSFKMFETKSELNPETNRQESYITGKATSNPEDGDAAKVTVRSKQHHPDEKVQQYKIRSRVLQNKYPSLFTLFHLHPHHQDFIQHPSSQHPKSFVPIRYFLPSFHTFSPFDFS